MNRARWYPVIPHVSHRVSEIDRLPHDDGGMGVTSNDSRVDLFESQDDRDEDRGQRRECGKGKPKDHSAPSVHHERREFGAPSLA
jgi:hypothetical protein